MIKEGNKKHDDEKRKCSYEKKKLKNKLEAWATSLKFVDFILNEGKQQWMDITSIHL